MTEISPMASAMNRAIVSAVRRLPCLQSRTGAVVCPADPANDIDVLTCEEADNLGVIWYENLALLSP
jgi:hypothetical protein